MTIRRQLLTSILLVGIPLIALQSYTIIEQYKSEQRRLLKKEMETAQTMASLVEVALRHLVHQHQVVGRLLAQNPHATREALAWVRQSSPLVVRAGYFTPDGRLVIVDPPLPEDVPVNISDRPHFQALLQGRDWAVSDLVVSRARGDPIVNVAIPVRGPNGGLMGVLGSAIKPEAFLSLLPFRAEDGDYFAIIDASGRAISSNLYRDPSWEERNWSGEPAIARAVAGTPTTVERFVHPSVGTRLMAAWVPVPSLGWAVGIMCEVDRQKGPVQRAAIIQLGSLVGVVLLSAVMAVRLAGRLHRPIMSLTGAARKLGEGDLGQRVEVSAGNEVRVLALAFNRMAEDIASYQTASTRQAEELRRKASQLQVLHELSCQLDSTLGLDGLLDLALAKVKDLVEADLALIFMFDAASDRLVFRSNPWMPERQLRAMVEAEARRWISGGDARGEEPLLIDHLSARPLVLSGPAGVDAIESLLAVPLKAKGRAIGTLTLTSTSAGHFTEQDIPFLCSVASVVAVAIDHARLHAQTRRDAEAKALLVRELDHRVRNNMATIIGLLSMELGRKEYRTGDEALKACVERVQSLAAIHDLLAQAEVEELDLRRLIEAVAEAVVRGYSREVSVALRLHAPPLRLPPKSLSAVALVATELITNALKHAFRAGDARWIGIYVSQEADEIQLEVRDNGVGIPRVIEEGQKRGVGLDIVASLVQTDLRGTFHLRNDGGTVAIIRFPSPQGLEN